MAGGNKAPNAKLRGDILTLPVAAATKIYRGTNVCIDSTGGLVEASDATGLKYAGVAEETIDNTSAGGGAALLGTLSCRVRRHGIYRMRLGSAANTYIGNAASDIGLVVYAVGAQTASVDECVGRAGNSTYKVPIGIITAVEPVIATSTYVWVDIQPTVGALLLASVITTHEAKVAQDANYWSGIIPETNTESGATPTLTSAEFIKGINLLTVAGTSTFTLPTSGPLAGTQCRFVKDSATLGNLIITGGTLTGKQTASNVFYGCPSLGDSVDIMCIGTNSYVVVNVNQAINPQTVSTDDPTITASQYMAGEVILSHAGATTTATTLPATGVPVGARCTFVKTGTAGSVKVTATTFVGAGTTTNVCTVQDAAADVITVENVAADSFRIISANIV